MNLEVIYQSLFLLQGAPGPVGAPGLPGSVGNQVRRPIACVSLLIWLKCL